MERDNEKYPMCERLAQNRGKKVELLEFITFLNENGIYLGRYEGDTLYSITSRPEQLVHEFLDIDDAKLEAERRQMLEELQEKNK